ncbi:MAG: hypothetical protein K9M75_04010 [Phycisphaerae bacterium]|nr:hypothetical protein [Phycisphaerae bacterium]
MKKLVLTMLVVALAIPAMAADISLTDNGDGTGTIVLTTAAGENVRGLAIVVESANPITAVAKGDAVFNVFMDAAYEAEAITPGSYAIGDGEPVADPDAKGTIALGGTRISLCMGALDETGNQAAVPAGTIDVATITTACGEVTITADALRGGIVGDAVVAGTIAGGPVCDGPTPCVGDGNGSGVVDTSDLGDMVALLSANPCDIDGWPGSCENYGYCEYKVTAVGNEVFDMNGDGMVDTSDLGDLVALLSANPTDIDGWPGSCENYGYCEYKAVCP